MLCYVSVNDVNVVLSVVVYNYLLLLLLFNGSLLTNVYTI